MRAQIIAKLKAWQGHLADSLQRALKLERLRTEPKVFKTPGDACSTTAVYVDNLFFLGPHETINKILKQIQRHLLLLQPTGELTAGKTVTFLGRNITHCGTHFELSLGNRYVDNIITEVNMETCNPSATLGTAALRARDEHEQDLSREEHGMYRRVVGKLQWLVLTGPELAYARALNKPTAQDWKRVNHVVRCLQGTKRCKFRVQPTAQTIDELKEIDVDAYVDADWAEDPVTRKSTSGFAIYVFGTCVQFGSRTQQTVALSSAESELTRSEQEQLNHYTSAISSRNYTATSRSTSAFSLTHQQESPLQHALAAQRKQTTSRSSISSRNNSFKPTSFQP